jgi:nicotinamidase/pyrazinamidase
MNLIFWDVDTQVDFMTPAAEGGKLYVHDLSDPADVGASALVPVLERLSDYARRHGILRVATGDWHTMEHREIDALHPDYRETFPPHCMAGEPGAEKIAETALRDPIVLPIGASDEEARAAARTAEAEGRDIFVEKQEFSCFTGNPATDALLAELRPDAVVIYGVSLDVCVRYAVEGMLERGLAVWVVEDATTGLGIEDPDALLARWAARGAHRITSAQVTAQYPPALG